MRDMTELEKRCLNILRARIGAEAAISYKDLAAAIGMSPRKVRAAVEGLINDHYLPICSSYDPRRPGYYWPAYPDEVADTCARLVRHGARIIRRARCIDKAAADVVMGQLRIKFECDEEG
ncbi:MAG: hypothetical protein LLG06_11690 [Desulfobacteraceae bacterium]|nr:hypothetical protein [Desulfobacteraceae bacterium]